MQVHYTTSEQVEQKIWLESLLAQSDKTLLYFYPKDNTPWCSLEAREFSLAKENFAKQGIQIIWVSRDTHQNHCNFINKQGLTIWLISDSELILHKQFNTRWEKKNYGKTFEGTIRSTFLLDKSGTILKEWRNVKATGHVARIMKELDIV